MILWVWSLCLIFMGGAQETGTLFQPQQNQTTYQMLDTFTEACKHGYLISRKNILNVLHTLNCLLNWKYYSSKNIFCIAIKVKIITIIIKKHDNQADHCERTPLGGLGSVMVILCCKGLAHWVGKVLYENIFSPPWSFKFSSKLP